MLAAAAAIPFFLLTDLNLLMNGKILVTSSEDFILIYLIPYLTQVYVISSHT